MGPKNITAHPLHQRHSGKTANYVAPASLNLQPAYFLTLTLGQACVFKGATISLAFSVSVSNMLRSCQKKRRRFSRTNCTLKEFEVQLP